MRPLFGNNQHLARHTIEPAVDHLLGCHLLGLKVNVGLCPGAGHHNGGADGTQFRADGAVIFWGACRLVGTSFLTHAPNNGVVRGARACDVYFFNQVVDAQILATFDSTPNNGQHAPVYEGLERGLQEFDQVLIDRVHFQNDDLVLIEELVKHIQRRDGGHVTGTQYQSHFALLVQRTGWVVGGGCTGCQVGGCDTRFHPDIDRNPTQQQVVILGMRQNPRNHLTVCQLAHRHMVQMVLVRHLRKSEHHLVAITHDGVGPRQPLLTDQR